ncbi:precorrin-6A reductase [Plebeiibacterium marinum]|uniref:Precorrin-6A reductase n=1 Tax=Plebeiibacterium marinum TaxID=2992111 RepID=A0AAE3MFT3_9BACT|nr:precorrin-6A reductase [Plebeiobacterium marinum]MCW3807183.1 precorrin-6A reductase [Plebeiobacterium marinum]
MIWIIGGTSDANKIADLLLNKGHQLLLSTTTSYGTHLAQKENIHIIQQQLNCDDMQKLISNYRIKTVIDASHPFAAEVSENAIKASNEEGTLYLRYERAPLKFDHVNYYHTYNEVIQSLKETHGNIMLTIGSKNVPLFNELSQRIVARVLPVIKSIEQCEQAGLKAHQVLAMKGLVNMDTNMALFKEYNIQHLVSKDSGEAGGLKEKVEAAQRLGIQVHLLKRPSVTYPNVFHCYPDILAQI